MMTPPEPQPGQQPPWQHPPPAPPPWHPPPPKRNTGRNVAIVVIVLLVLAVAATVIVLQTRDRESAAGPETQDSTTTAPDTTETTIPTTPAGPPDEGNCVEDTSVSADDAEVVPVPCDAPEAVYRVAKTLPEPNADCPGSDYTLYYLEDPNGFTMCLMLNAKEGDCFINVENINENVARVDCAEAQYKVVDVVEGQADEAACPTDDAVVPHVYPEPPPSTVCVETL